MRRTIKRALIALNLEALDSPGLVSFTRGVGKGLTDNPNLTQDDVIKLPVAVGELLKSATLLETTHTARATASSKTNTKIERAQANGLMEQLTQTAAFVEGIANTKAAGSLPIAQAIITSCGFSLKKSGTRPTKGFEVDSPAKGAAHVHLPKGGVGEVRLLRYSTDGGKTYSLPIVVHGRDMTITGLTSGATGQFEYATSTPPLKKSKASVVAGSEALQWGDAATCTIS